MGELLNLITGGLIGLIVMILLVLTGIVFLLMRFLQKVEPGKALIIISPFKGIRVSFTGAIVLPIIHRMEVMDISTKMITVTREGHDGLICADNIRADISVNFYLRVNPTREDVTAVAQSIGIERASTRETLDTLFQAKFAEGLKTVGKQMDFEDLFMERTSFKERIIKTIGENLNGYSLEDTAIDHLEQTPLDQLDENNIMDAEGIRKITEITLTKKEVVAKRETETRERILELEKQRKEAEARQQSEVAIIQARESAEAKRVGEEERLKAEGAKISTDENLAVAEVNKNRQVEVAEKNREREVAVESERVEKDRALEATEREKLVALAGIEKEKVVAQEKKNIADIVRQRVAVERTVAEEEEETKNTRAFADADRTKRVSITLAEKDAEEALVLEIKSAEAKEKAAVHLSKEKEIKADVELSTSSKLAEAKRTLAEGVIAEESARGLAEVKVKEADAEAIRKVGEAEAKARQYDYEVEAKGLKEKGLAEAEVKNVAAEAEERMGEAEAKAMEMRYTAEAKGMAEKSEALRNYDDVGRAHEEYKLQLQLQEKLEMERIGVRKQIALSQAEILATALQNANIDIVGGDGQFFDKIVGAIGDGKASTAYLENNLPLTEIKDALIKPGDGNLIERVMKLAGSIGYSAESLRDLTLSAALLKIATSSNDPEVSTQTTALRDLVEKIGLGEIPLHRLFG